MASLTYMIYQENKKGEPPPGDTKDANATVRRPPTSLDASNNDDHDHDLHHDHDHDLHQAMFSSFRKRSVIVDPVLPRKQWESVGTLPPRPPKLRELIRESGLLQTLEQDEDLYSILEEEVDDHIWKSTMENDKSANRIVVNQTLKEVMYEVLTMDDQGAFLPYACVTGARLYHSGRSTEWASRRNEISSDTVSIPSQPSKESSFEEIPHYYGTPQFEPQYLTPLQLQVHDSVQLKFAKSSPPAVEASQPSRSKLDSSGKRPAQVGHPLQGPSVPTTKPATPSVGTNNGPQRDPTTVNQQSSKAISDHFPSQITRFDSMQSYQTMVSEITMSAVMSPLKIDPRAPQYRMALDQEERRENPDNTVRTHNHNHTVICVDQSKPSLPTRRETPKGESPNAPIRKQSTRLSRTATNNDPYANTPNFGFSVVVQEKTEESPFRMEPVGRRGTMGGPAVEQPMSSMQPQARLLSPGESSGRDVFEMPSTPQQDSNPLMYCGNLLVSPADATSVSQESIVGPFSVERRLYRVMPNTPEHNSNPLLFPHGIGYYPPSPSKLPVPPHQVPSPANTPAIEDRNISISKQGLPNLLLPLETTSACRINDEEDEGRTTSQSSGETSGQSSGQSTTEDDPFPPRNSHKEVSSSNRSFGTATSIRVKHSPREIVYIDQEGYERVHMGYYSGAINRHNQLHGNGIFWFLTGDLYLGQFCHGELHGVGAISMHGDGDGDGDGRLPKILRGFFRWNAYVGAEWNKDDDAYGDTGEPETTLIGA